MDGGSVRGLKSALAEAAQAVDKVAKTATGLSADTAETIKRAILGVGA